jgi:hypothetical protein
MRGSERMMRLGEPARVATILEPRGHLGAGDTNRPLTRRVSSELDEAGDVSSPVSRSLEPDSDPRVPEHDGEEPRRSTTRNSLFDTLELGPRCPSLRESARTCLR